ncbi:hypothetical protein BR93DRAFT_989904 [Coniochaeta sp. PMI_546]|nr:hypothetical protein BR93DRAFT_989904 [Coniochaeta sp. PMI_546]
MEEEEESRQPPRKRHRVAVACDECRRRKIRCDGVQPLCSFCRQQDLCCAYHKGPQRVQVTQDYLESLIKQVHDLKRKQYPVARQYPEETVQGPEYDGYMYQEAGGPVAESASSTISPSTCDPTHKGVERVSSPIPVQQTMREPQSGTITESPQVIAVFEDAVSVTESATDTIVCAGSPPPATGGSYFGASSTPAFLDAVQAMTASGEGNHHSAKVRTRVRPRVGENRRTTGTSTCKANPSSGIKSLPPRWTADHLVDTYFSHVCITFTVLHEPTFRDEYERLWRPGSLQPEPIRLCVSHAVFALGALFSDRLAAEESESLAETLFAQAKELCDLDSLDEGSLVTVQALLLMGHYLHVKRVSRCWHIFGLAIRTAQGLGLHLSDINNKYGLVEREMRKRCWCGCLVMDAMLAMTFGRPTMILPEYYQNVELPEPVHDGQITVTGISRQQVAAEVGDASAKPPNVLLFIQRVELCIILHSILRTLYEPVKRTGETTTLRVREMAELDQQLSLWLAQLPATMQMKQPQGETPQPSSNSNSSVPSHMIYTRYLTVRILLTRPSLVAVAFATARNGPGANSKIDGLPPLDHSFAICAAQACIDTSKRLLDHIRGDTGLQRRVVGATWYNTNCVFNAALVIFSAHIIPDLQASVAGQDHWQSSIDLMRSFSRNCRSAQACLSMLEMLNSHLEQSKH